MDAWERIQGDLHVLLMMAVVFLVIGTIIALAHWLLLGRQKHLEKSRRFPRQIILFLIVLFCAATSILALPISDSARSQLIGLLGIVLSGMIAFSSTTAMANLIGGLLLRITKPFHIGDFIRVGEHFGRVSEQGLFDTEIQSETRELIALPNAYLFRNPVSTIHSAGAIISATLSLGYETDHSRIETLLCTAAEKSGLEDPFVHITELGNYSVTYRISGVLPEVKWMLTAKSKLHTSILDTLHRDHIEIMSPTYMNQRRITEDQKIIPPAITADAHAGVPVAEKIIFDKAEEAERQETQKQALQNRIETLEQDIKTADSAEKKKLKEQIQTMTEHLNTLEKTPKNDEA